MFIENDIPFQLKCTMHLGRMHYALCVILVFICFILDLVKGR